MADRALGVGAFGAGLAKSLAGAYADKRERERAETRRKEDRAYEVEKFKFQTMLPSLLENIEDVDDETLANEFPTIFGGKQKAGIGKTRGAITSALKQFQPGDQGLFNEGAPAGVMPQAAPVAGAQAPPASAGKVVMTDLDTGAAIGEAPAVPRRTLMGVPILSSEEKIERGLTKMEIEARGKADLARRILPILKEMDPTATADDAAAYVGIRTPSATARSAAAMRPQSIRGTVNGEPAFGIFDPTTKGYVYPAGSVIAGKDVGGQPIPNFQPLTSQDTMSFGVDREAIAQSVFGKRYGQLTPQEQSIVLREEKTQLQSEATSRTLGAGQGRFQAPIDIKTAQETGVPVGTSAQQVAGQVVPTQQQIDRRKSVVQLQQGLTDIRDRLLVALPKETELQGLAPGAAYAVRRRLPQYRNQIASLESAINNVVNVMARSVGEQRGTQTERDALRAEAAIAQIRDALLTGDTQESAKARITESLAVLDRIMSQLPQPVQPVGGMAPNAAPTVQPVQPTPPTAIQNQPAQPPQVGAQTPRTSRAIRDAAGNWVIVTTP